MIEDIITKSLRRLGIKYTKEIKHYKNSEIDYEYLWCDTDCTAAKDIPIFLKFEIVFNDITNCVAFTFRGTYEGVLQTIRISHTYNLLFQHQEMVDNIVIHMIHKINERIQEILKRPRINIKE